MNPTSTRVLIVDDDRDISALLSALMRKEGLNGMMAHDGETALRMVLAARPDVLLVDVKMPGIDGMTVLSGSRKPTPICRWFSSLPMPRFPRDELSLREIVHRSVVCDLYDIICRLQGLPA